MTARFRLLLGVLMAGLAPLGVAADDTETVPATAAAVGTTIFGDHEQALGLYLMPWKEEAASDIDRPPQLLHLMPALGTPDAARTRAVLYESINAYRHAQVGKR
ncbi:hypothetical protein [Polycyclovorans algicola]|uniref:hypothetical protein n=1 Tax=Polycyclovorans algicola TaxID=616992 RepID=UPI0004A73265|nr:hypothetical protein [Polycyclovorans algicola]